jgi:hypothetical protein
VAVPPYGKAVVRLQLQPFNTGPFSIDLAFWTAEPHVLRRVPFTARGEAR